MSVRDLKHAGDIRCSRHPVAWCQFVIDLLGHRATAANTLSFEYRRFQARLEKSRGRSQPAMAGANNKRFESETVRQTGCIPQHILKPG